MNPSVNSISYLSVLDTLLVHIHAQGAAATQDGLLDRILVFLLTFDPIQIRYVGGSLTSLLMHVGSGQMFPVCMMLCCAALRSPIAKDADLSFAPSSPP